MARCGVSVVYDRGSRRSLRPTGLCCAEYFGGRLMKADYDALRKRIGRDRAFAIVRGRSALRQKKESSKVTQAQLVGEY